MVRSKRLLRTGTDIIIGAALIGVTGQVGKGVPLIRTVQTLQSIGLVKKAKRDLRL